MSDSKQNSALESQRTSSSRLRAVAHLHQHNLVALLGVKARSFLETEVETHPVQYAIQVYAYETLERALHET